MLKNIFLVSGLVLCSIVSGQETKKKMKVLKQKWMSLHPRPELSQNLLTQKPYLKASFGSAETRIRKISNGAASAYFYQISKEGKYSNTTASIEYTDLIEVLKALKALQMKLIMIFWQTRTIWKISLLQ
jgi:hypothetical protein